MVGELPANVSFGTVTGRFVLAVADSADGGTDPDGQAASGTVTFTPSVTYLKDVSSTPPTTIIPAAIICTLDSDGIMNDPQGNDFVKLVATDDTDLDPVGWTWQVAIEITGAQTRSFDIAVPAGGAVDLTTLSPVASSTGNSTLAHSERENEADQLITDLTSETVLWPTSIAAERGGLTHNSLTGVWTVGVAGTYLVAVSLTSTASGTDVFAILKDGATTLAQTDGGSRVGLVSAFDALAGDEVSVQVASGGTGDIEIAGGGYATVHRLV